MTKTLTWYLPGQLTEGTAKGSSFRMDDNYQVVHVWANAGTAPTGSNLIFDILEDGMSLFSATKPSLVQSNTVMDDGQVVYTFDALSEGSVLTLNVLQVGNGEPGRDLTVQLDIEALGT